VAVIQSTPPFHTVGLPLSSFGSNVILSNSITVNITDRYILRPNPGKLERKGEQEEKERKRKEARKEKKERKEGKKGKKEK
jgi:hypothetical protein